MGSTGPLGSDVRLRVRQEGSDGEQVVSLPAKAFVRRDGAVDLTGTRVAIAVDHKIELGESHVFTQKLGTVEDARFAAPGPRSRGDLSARGVDLGQTTAFYAANQVIELAERIEGRRIPWGDNGRLTIALRTKVDPNPFALNEEIGYDCSTRRIDLAAVGDVRNGRLVAYHGSGLSDLDMAIDREQRILASRDPMMRAAAQRHLSALGRLTKANQAGDVAATKRILAAELGSIEGLNAGSMTNRVSPGQLIPKLKAALTPGTTLNQALDNLRQLALSAPRTRQAVLYYEALTSAQDQLALARPQQGVRVDAAESHDITAHEAGHALLHVLKPALESMGGAAMNEAYGDLYAMFSACDNDATLRSAIAATHGDLRRSNVLSRIGEPLGDAINAAAVKPRSTRGVRDLSEAPTVTAIAATDKTKASTLLNSERFDILGAIDPHHVSKLISAPFYRVFAERASSALVQARAHGTSELTAVRRVRDEVAGVLHDTLLYMKEDGGSVRDIGASALYAAGKRDAGRTTGWTAAMRTALTAQGYPADLGEPVSVRSLPPFHIVPNKPKNELMRDPVVRTFLNHWNEQCTPLLRMSLAELRVVQDVHNGRGERIIRIGKVDPSDRNDIDYAGAIVIDETGSVISASSARPPDTSGH